VCTCLIARRTLTLDCPSPGYHLFFASPDRTLTDLMIVECVPKVIAQFQSNRQTPLGVGDGNLPSSHFD